MKKLFRVALAALLLVPAAACTDKETEIGLNLVDSTTLYDGKTHTLYANAAYSLRDDSLATSNYSFGIIGNYTDPLFGKVSSELYTQVAIASGMNTIDFDEVTIDSVVLCLTVDALFPDTASDRVYNFHFKVEQLDEAVMSDTIYYSNRQLPVKPGAVFFDATVNVTPQDSVVYLKMNSSINDVLKYNGTSEEFLEHVKGLKVSILDDASEGMLGISFAATKTCLRAHYHLAVSTGETTWSVYEFLVGTGAAHFTHFSHDYTGTMFDGNDSIDGSQLLYLEPMAGYNARLSFDADLRAFHEAHPLAVVHHAELLMPLAAAAPAEHPEKLVALAVGDSTDVAIDDYIDRYTYSGFDGTYDAVRDLYRIRITQHLQGLLRSGADPGMSVVLDARRSSGQRTVICGPQAATPVKIVLVYTE